MIVQRSPFYVFAAVCIFSGVMVISGTHRSIGVVPDPRFFTPPDCSCSGRRVPAMILVVVYVGAVAVLFRFVVMMPTSTSPNCAAA